MRRRHGLLLFGRSCSALRRVVMTPARRLLMRAVSSSVKHVALNIIFMRNMVVSYPTLQWRRMFKLSMQLSRRRWVRRDERSAKR